MRTTRDVAFLADHSWFKCFGTTADGSLELLETDAGLAFALRTTDDEEGCQLVADVKAGLLQMSVGYTNEFETKHQIAGEDVVFVEKASLSEISAVRRPAVKRTSISVVEAPSFGRLADACRSGRMAGYHAAARVENSFTKLRAALASVERLA